MTKQKKVTKNKNYMGPETRMARDITLVQIIICVIAVVGMILATIFLNPEIMAKRLFTEMTYDYYENYYYERFLDGRNPSEEIFKDYVESGFPVVTLRQLLTFDNARNGDRAENFYYCDKKISTATIRPVAPFGKKDYELTEQLDCKFK